MRLVAGLDIGTTKVCLATAESGLGGRPRLISLTAAECRGLKRGVVVDMDDTVEAIREVIAKAGDRIGEHLDNVYVGVTGEHILSLNSEGVTALQSAPVGEITQADVTKVIEESQLIPLAPDREVIHAIPRGFVVDGQHGIRRPIGMSGARLEVQTHIVTGASASLQNIERCVQRAGLNIADVVLEPLASSHAVLSRAEMNIGVALVDIGGGTSDIAVFADGAIAYSAAVPVGGQLVTLDISKLLRTMPEEAERLKIEYGCATTKLLQDTETIEVTQLGARVSRALPRRVLVEVIEPRMRELLRMVRAHLERSDEWRLLPGGIVFTGGGSQLPGTPELAQEILGAMPSRVGGPANADGLTREAQNPAYATAIGLVCYAAQVEASRSTPIQNGAGRIRDFVRKWLLLGKR